MKQGETKYVKHSKVFKKQTGQVRKSNTYVIGVIENNREKGIEAIFEDIISKKFSKLITTNKPTTETL